MAGAQILEHVEGLGDIYFSEAPLTKQLNIFRETGIEYPISVRDVSYIRLNGEYKGHTRTCHAPILAKDSPTIIARISPLIEDPEMAEKAIEAHKNDQYPMFGKDVYDFWFKIAEEDKIVKKPENRRAILLPERESYSIHKNSDEARFFYRDTRQEYFERFVLGDGVKIEQIDPKIVDSQDKTIVNYLCFDDGIVGWGSVLDCCGKGLWSSMGVTLGVKKEDVEPLSKKVCVISLGEIYN